MSQEPSDPAHAPQPDRPEVERADPAGSDPGPAAAQETEEAGGPKGLEPTRYGDWERNGRCIDF